MARKVSRGFTLIEIVVAMTIFATVSVVLMESFSGGLRSVDDARHRVIATLIAQSRLATVGAEIPVAPGTYTGTSGEGYHWTVAIRLPTGSESNPTTTNLTLYDVIVTVDWPGSRTGQAVTLTTLRLAAEEALRQ